MREHSGWRISACSAMSAWQMLGVRRRHGAFPRAIVGVWLGDMKRKDGWIEIKRYSRTFDDGG